jgi:hypothetical protein
VALLLIVSGPPGAGKSTVSELVAGELGECVLVRGDRFFGFLTRGGIAPWLPEAGAQNEVVATAIAAATGAYVRGGYDTVVDSLIWPASLSKFLDAAGAEDGHYVVLCPPVEQCVHNVRTRLDHGFADDLVTKSLHAQFEEDLVPARQLITSWPDAPTETCTEILRRLRAGELSCR